MGEGVYVIWGGRKYLRTEDETNVYLKDVSENKVKANAIFSKNKEKTEESIRQFKSTLQEVLP